MRTLFIVLTLVSYAPLANTDECKKMLESAFNKVAKTQSRNTCSSMRISDNEYTRQSNFVSFTETFLNTRSTDIVCSGDTIQFKGKINKKNIDELFNLIALKIPSDDDMIRTALVKASLDPTKFRNNKSTSCNSKNDTIKKKTKSEDKKECLPKKLIISSEGGLLDQALRLYGLVNHLQLEVYVPDGEICMSACTHLGIFAKDFKWSPKSLFMFHGPQTGGNQIVNSIITNCEEYNNVGIFWQFEHRFPQEIVNGMNIHTNFFVTGAEYQKYIKKSP